MFRAWLTRRLDMPFTNSKPLKSFTKIINKWKLPLNIKTCLFQKKLLLAKRESFLFPKVHLRHTKVSFISTNNDKAIVPLQRTKVIEANVRKLIHILLSKY